ncbi:ADP-ribosyltransferase [Vibrio campbellii]|uniref:NAD(+)--arginine ADP-ribosyltransferase n=1 Tax=Vibrio campbellii TaxID=680 RepID=A0AAE9SIK1_9VIBR|nr:ADP-ribosyltransferase [Vibrio campbellii]UTZ21549.1 NAD(+)--arginine ADP-ribosyltransferase [Vibrio campbellii]UTZ25479.1 NAD(+)--arginine ADP-ribosyltransferase [Vibrio campbellii]
MLRFIALFTLCLSATINAEVFDALKAPLRSHIQVEELASQFSDWAKASSGWRFRFMTEKDLEALEDFSVSGYQSANDYLRATDTSTWGQYGKTTKKFIKQVRGAMSKLPEYKGITYRGAWVKESLLNKLQVGDVVVEPAFTSSSAIPEVAKRFAITRPNSPQPLQRALYEIQIKSNGRALGGLSEFGGEAEVLLPPNTYYKVTKIELNRGSTMLALETVSSHDAVEGMIYNLYSGEEINQSYWRSLACL